MACLSSKPFLLTLFLSFLLFSLVYSVEFEVGEDEGWAIPPSKNQQFYNQWASKNRFQVADSVHFKYKKDSVLVVTDEEYEKCHSATPVFFANNGDTVFKFDRPGLFYFISGVSGHCERGQKMIIKVLDAETPPPPSNSTTPPGSPDHSAAVPMAGILSIVLLFVVSLAGFFSLQS